MKVTDKTTVPEVLKMSKNTAKVFKKYDLDCISCKGAQNETLDKVAMNKGLDLQEFLKALQSAIDEK